jgi:hypothetical protein
MFQSLTWSMLGEQRADGWEEGGVWVWLCDEAQNLMATIALSFSSPEKDRFFCYL